MFTKLTNAYKVVSNLVQIQVVVSAAFVSIIKTRDILAYIINETNTTKFGKLVGEYLPPVISILDKVKALILKYGTYIGFDGAAVAQSADKLDDLKHINDSLDELLK